MEMRARQNFIAYNNLFEDSTTSKNGILKSNMSLVHVCLLDITKRIITMKIYLQLLTRIL